MFKKIKNEVKRLSTQFKTLMIIAITTTPNCAFADGETTATNLFGKIIGTAGNLFVMLGSFLLVYALGSLFMAFKNEDADSKSKAGMYLLVALLLVSVPQIYTALTGDTNLVKMGNSLI